MIEVPAIGPKRSDPHYQRWWRKKNPASNKASQLRYRKNHPDRFRKSQRKYKDKRRAASLEYVIMERIANNVRDALRHPKTYKTNRTVELLGISKKGFMEYLESKFTDGMSWENYGITGWHLDHIRPAIEFDLTKPEEQQKCFHYTNLQPLWWIDNIHKRDTDKAARK